MNEASFFKQQLHQPSQESEDSLKVDPKQYLPQAEDEMTIQLLKESVGATGKHELDRSKIYRAKKQIDRLRTFFKDIPETEKPKLLNIGVGNLEEAINYSVLLKNAGLLNEASLDFVDIREQDDINPEYSLGINFMGQPIEPANEDKSAYTFSSGEWNLNPDVREFIEGNLGRANFLGSSVESFLHQSEEGNYDVVSFNNVAQYLGKQPKYDNPIYQESGDFKQFLSVILLTAEKTRKDGLFLMYLDIKGIGSWRYKSASIPELLRTQTNFEEIFEKEHNKYGIYRRISDEKLVFTSN